MRWFWQRRRNRQAAVETPPSAPIPAAPASVGTVQRAPTTSGRLGQSRHLSSELLELARDYLQAVGGRVRVEDEDVLSATLPDGRNVRYTTTLAKARSDESMTLLVEGSEALAAMLDDIAARSRLTALWLDAATDPVALALDRCAPPAARCGRCVESSSGEDAQTALCPVCPLRESRIVLRWRTPGALTARVMRQEQAVSVELAYLVVARDRQGRRDEWLRHAVDVATGQAIPPLSAPALAVAQPDTLPADYERTLTAVRASAERSLGEPLVASGMFLRQRSLDEYLRRLEEVATTFDRLQRESPEMARAAKAGRGRELAALAEVYAVDVEAQLESACFITSPVVLVALRPQKGRGEVLLRVDVGRQHVLPPQCAACGTAVRAGQVCDEGHVVCAACFATCSTCGAWQCPVCNEASQSVCVKCGQPTVESHRIDRHPEETAAIFTARHLEALPPEMWLTAMEWLLSCQRITTEARRITGDLVIWQGQSETGKVMVAAQRSPGRWALDEIAIRQAAAHLAPEQPAMARLMLSTAPATGEAAQVARQLGIQLMDRHSLETLLSGLASAHERERERQIADMQARADAAGSARQAMLDAVDAIGQALTPVRRARKAGTQTSAGTSGSRKLIEARAAIERASLAWETLVNGWTESFSERPARNGSLVISGEVSQFAEMIERVAHLQPVLLEAARLLMETPARGEGGYTTLRQAVLEEYQARCDAWRWRIRSYDPEVWSDFTRAWNAKAAAKAAEATTAAGHATARADKAQAQAPRAG
ncbi:MAG TPA: hypothetical protein VF040_01765 [Ktedonobacterales bacterium]